MPIKTEQTIYEVGWRGDSSGMAIDRTFIEAEHPAQAVEIYCDHRTILSDVLSKFFVKKLGIFQRTYLVGKVTDKTGKQVFKVIQNGWYPWVWM